MSRLILLATLDLVLLIWCANLLFGQKGEDPILAWLRGKVVPWFRKDWAHLFKRAIKNLPHPVVLLHQLKLKLLRRISPKPVQSATRLELSLDPEYVSWDLWACVRELLQNAKDAADIGHKMTVELTDGGVLRIKNDGAALTRKSLILGGTSKRGTSQRGQFGEGYKLAFATLLRAGRSIRVFNQGEIWQPAIEWSSAFHSDVMVVHISPAPNPTQDLTIEVAPIIKSEFASIKTRLLFDRQEELAKTKVSSGILLKSPDLTNKLFVKGIYINELPGRFAFGYDLFHLKLNRDRSLADPWSMKREVHAILDEALYRGILAPEILYKALSSGHSELDAISEADLGGSKVYKAAAEVFISTYGEKAVPVSSNAESSLAELCGRKPIVVNSKLAEVLKKGDLHLDALRHIEDTDPKRIYELKELAPAERNRLADAMKLAFQIEPACKVQVVDFIGDTILGLYQNPILIARKALENDEKVIATLVHELAHKYGADGTYGHRYAEERIFSAIIRNLKAELSAQKKAQ